MSDSGGRDWFRTYTGKSKAEAFQRPSAQSSIDQYVARVKSKFPLIPLGWSDEGEVTISQEDRASHMHILGATQEGKSKFIELLVRDDIKNGYGACVIDPSRGGATVYKILKHCASIRYDKVCLIDPSDFHETGRIPAIQPLRDGIPESVINGNLMDVTRVLWSADEFSKNPRIQRYLPAVIQALVANKLTLAEIKYWLSNVDYWDERERMLAHPDIDSLNRNHLKGAFKNTFTYEHFQSTVNRLNPFNDPVLRLVFGSRKTWGGEKNDANWGIPWSKLITEGWLILVNADPTDVWGYDNPVPQRLLATLVISELVYTISRLLKRGWQGAYYLYIDEVGYYSTRKLEGLLNYHAKTGLRLVMAHQHFDQIEDTKVLAAIRTNAKNKVLFHTPNSVDRETMMRDMGYGGDLPDRQVSYILQKLNKGEAAVSVGKKNPRIVRIKRIDDAEVSREELTSFKEQVYSQEWYYPAKEIEDELNARFSDFAAPTVNPAATTTRPRHGKRGPKGGSAAQPVGGAPDDDKPAGGAPKGPKKGGGTKTLFGKGKVPNVRRVPKDGTPPEEDE